MPSFPLNEGALRNSYLPMQWMTSYVHDFSKHNSETLNREIRKSKELREECTLECTIEAWCDLCKAKGLFIEEEGK